MTRLHSRIYLHFLGVLVVVGLATSIAFALGARGAFLRETGERVARHVASLIGEQLGDPVGLQRRLEQLHSDLDVDVTVRDVDGRLLASAGRELPPLEGDDATAVRAGDVVVQGRPRWFGAAPVRAPGSPQIVATVQAAAHRHMGFPGLWRPVLGVTLVLLIVAVGTAPLARRLSRPIARLTEATRRLGGGDLAYRIVVADPARRHRRRRDGRRPDELQQLTHAFNEMAERIERLVRGHAELLANVSHELRSPLARIRVALELLPRGIADETRLRDIEAELADLDRLVEDVLTAARLDATGLPFRLGSVETVTLLAQVAERARQHPLLDGKPIVVTSASPVTLVADEALLRRALWNLVENAAKYGAPPITLTAERDGDSVRLSVTDAGEGIPADEREQVLAPFYRRDRDRASPAGAETTRGFGLGLTLARRVAEVHGGRISLGPASTTDGREHGCRASITLLATVSS